jgi:FixJ family two-component response regulator
MIAIVDDDDAVRVATERLIRALGYSASTFASAGEFLKSDQVGDTSCLIADLHMPGLSGFDLQDRLIAQGRRIPIIFISAYPEESAKVRAAKAGAVGFLSKPFTHEQLAGYLEMALKSA